jgi:hypothetical protein
MDEYLCIGVMEPVLIKTTSRLKTEAEENPSLSGRGFPQVTPVTSSVSTENSRLRSIWKSLAISCFVDRRFVYPSKTTKTEDVNYYFLML